MLPRKLLDILACPKCKSPLAYSEEKQTFRCATCRVVYPVRDGIPILLVDEAVPETNG